MADIESAAPEVCDVIAEQFGTRRFTYVSTFEDLNGDSLDPIELLVKLEDKFKIKITDDEGASLENVGHVIALVNRKLGRG